MLSFEFHGIAADAAVQDSPKTRHPKFVPGAKPRRRSNKKEKKDSKKLKREVRRLTKDMTDLKQQVEHLRDHDCNGFYTLRKKGNTDGNLLP